MLFTVVVRTEATTEKTKIVPHRGPTFGFRLNRPPGIAYGLLEPAVGSGAYPCKDSSALESSTKDEIQAVFTPQDDEVSTIAASDVDDIELHHERGEIISGHAKQGEVPGSALERGERIVEPADVVILVSACRRHEADYRIRGARLGQNVPIQQKILRLHREAASAHRDDFLLHRRHPHRLTLPLARAPRGARLRRFAIAPSALIVT